MSSPSTGNLRNDIQYLLDLIDQYIYGGNPNLTYDQIKLYAETSKLNARQILLDLQNLSDHVESGNTTYDVLIDCGSYLTPSENVLIDCGSYTSSI